MHFLEVLVDLGQTGVWNICSVVLRQLFFNLSGYKIVLATRSLQIHKFVQVLRALLSNWIWKVINFDLRISILLWEFSLQKSTSARMLSIACLAEA